jgi:hypothetical protein
MFVVCWNRFLPSEPGFIGKYFVTDLAHVHVHALACSDARACSTVVELKTWFRVVSSATLVGVVEAVD